jgi:MFS family permease
MSLYQTIFDSYGFSTIVVATSLLTAISLCLMKFRARSFNIGQAQDGHVHFMAVLRSKTVVATSIGHFGGSFAFGAILTFTPLAAIQRGIDFYSIFFIFFAISVICSRLFVQRIIDSLGIKKACIYAYSAMLLGALPLLSPLSSFILVISGLFFGAGFGIAFPAFVLFLVQRIKSAKRGTALSILIAAGDTANAISIAALGWIAEDFGYPYLFLVVSLVLIVCMYRFYSLVYRRKRGSASRARS